MDKPTEFDYLLNRMEHAGQQERPAEHHYGTHRASLMRHVRSLEKDAERYRWLRDVGDETWVPMGKRPGVNFTHEIDQAIDAAIARTKAVGAA